MADSSEFEFFTESDKKSMAYRLCVLGLAGIGTSMGSPAGGMTIPGAIGGLLRGMATRLYLAEPVQRPEGRGVANDRQGSAGSQWRAELRRQ